MAVIQPVYIPAKQNLVDLFKDALKNEIKLIELLPEAEKGEKE